jgi:uncharacterized protein with GYD domain
MRTAAPRRTKGDQSFAQQVEAIGQVRQQHGGRLLSAYVTFGRYDLLFIVEYPDQKSALAAVETSLAKGLFTLEVEEAIEVDDFLKMGEIFANLRSSVSEQK